MLMSTIVRGALVILCVLIFSGCAKKEQAPAQEEAVKTQAEYKAEADKEINEQNMAEELDELEKDVNADAGQTP